MIRLARSCLLSLCAAVMPPAWAVDYDEFQVPVRLENIHPDVERAKVSCYVKNDRGDVVARGTNWVTLRGGGANTTVRVTAHHEDNRWQGIEWYCVVGFADPFDRRTMTYTEYRDRYGVESGSTHRWRTEGTIE